MSLTPRAAGKLARGRAQLAARAVYLDFLTLIYIIRGMESKKTKNRRLLHGFQFHPPSRKTAAWAVAVGPFSQTRGLSDLSPALFFYFDFILEKPATRPRDRCGKEQLVYPFVTGSPGSSRVSALAPYSSGGRVGSTLSTPHAGGDVGLFVGECSSPQTDAPKQRRGMSHQRPDLSSHSRDDSRPNFQIWRDWRVLGFL